MSGLSVQLRLPESVTAMGNSPDEWRAWARRWLSAQAMAQGMPRWRADEVVKAAAVEAHEEDPHDFWLVVPQEGTTERLRVHVLVP